APNDLSYSENPAVYTRSFSISPNTARCSGGGLVSSYSVDPALPPGLSLNASTGTISGTPDSVTASANYVITAVNSGGSTSTQLFLTVNDLPPSGLQYSAAAPIYTRNVAISANL